jgi:hypothetical protein
LICGQPPRSSDSPILKSTSEEKIPDANAGPAKSDSLLSVGRRFSREMRNHVTLGGLGRPPLDRKSDDQHHHPRCQGAGLMPPSEQAVRDLPGLDVPLRLKQAVELAFPFGGMTVSGLRRERDRGNLHIEKIAGKEFTTLRNIEEMRARCRAQLKAPDCGQNPRSATTRESSYGAQHGSLETGRVEIADVVRLTS